MRVRLLLATLALRLVLWAMLPLSSSGQSSKQHELTKLQQRIDRAREKIGRKRGTERVLSTAIAGYTQRIRRLQGKIATLTTRQQRIQTERDAKLAELERLRTQLRRERARLVRLRKRLAETRAVLSNRLVEIYKAQKPDVISVILNSDGFADLIERGEFIKRISHQDRRIVTFVAARKADATRSERRLDRLERRQQNVTAVVQQRRDQVSAVRMELVGTRVGYTRTKAGKATALKGVRGQRVRLESNLDELEAASRRVTSQLQAAQRRNIVLLQGVGASGGYGNYTCVQHTATMSTCYAHQCRLGTTQGASVSQGQVIGYVGNTGNSFGAHLHFEVRVNGAPVDPVGYL